VRLRSKIAPATDDRHTLGTSRLAQAVIATVGIASVLLGLAASSATAVGPFPDYTPPRTTNMDACPSVAVVGFRGSGEAFDDGTLGLGGVKPLYDALSVRFGAANVGASAVSYPAVPWAISVSRLDAWLADINYGFRNVFLGQYPDSVATGANDGLSDITHLAVRCPSTKIVVAGFSQGAEVARRVLNGLNTSAGSHVVAAVFMGDPTFRAGETGVVRVGGTAPAAQGVSWIPYGSTIVPIQSRYHGRVISACHDSDIVCRGQAGASLSGHNYAGDSTALADFVSAKINPPPAGTTCEAFVADLTIPDGTVLAAGASFTKVWRLRNCGTASWSGLTAVRTAGVFGPGAFSVPATSPGATADLTVPMIAPSTAGLYRSTYRLRAPNGTYASGSFWVEINVTGTAPHDCEAFVADITIPDGTTISGGTSFTKIWRLRNCGNTNWSGLTAVRLDGGFGPSTFSVPTTAPGANADLVTSMTAPSAAGHYRSTYRLQAPDGHFADNSFWVDINVVAVDRTAIVSYDRMAPGAPYHGYYTSAWQNFIAQSNRITYLGVTVGNPTLPAGQPVGANVTIRICTNPNCSTVLAQGAPQVINYGNTAVDIGNVAVTPGATYYIVWYQPPAVNGATWVTYWWAGGSSITQSDQMQAVVRGYNA